MASRRVGPADAGWQIIFGDVTVRREGELLDRFRAGLGFAPHFMLISDDVPRPSASWRRRGLEIAEQPHQTPPVTTATIEDLHGDAITLADLEAWQILSDLEVPRPRRVDA